MVYHQYACLTIVTIVALFYVSKLNTQTLNYLTDLQPLFTNNTESSQTEESEPTIVTPAKKRPQLAHPRTLPKLGVSHRSKVERVEAEVDEPVKDSAVSTLASTTSQTTTTSIYNYDAETEIKNRHENLVQWCARQPPKTLVLQGNAGRPSNNNSNKTSSPAAKFTRMTYRTQYVSKYGHSTVG